MHSMSATKYLLFFCFFFQSICSPSPIHLSSTGRYFSYSFSLVLSDLTSKNHIIDALNSDGTKEVMSRPHTSSENPLSDNPNVPCPIYGISTSIDSPRVIIELRELHTQWSNTTLIWQGESYSSLDGSSAYDPRLQ